VNDQDKRFSQFEQDHHHRLNQVGIIENDPRIQIELTTGQKLAKARKSLNLTTDEIAGALYLREEFISTIEAGSYSNLPGIAYATGYVRAYAALVDLDQDELINSDPDLGIRAIDQDIEPKNEKTIMLPAAREAPNFNPNINWLKTAIKGLSILLLISLLILGWNYWKDFANWWSDRIMSEKIIELERESDQQS